MAVATVVFKRVSTYADKTTGEVKTAREIVLLPPKPRLAVDGEEGSCPLTFNPRFDISEFHPGDVVEYEVRVQQNRFGTRVDLVDIVKRQKE